MSSTDECDFLSVLGPDPDMCSLLHVKETAAVVGVCLATTYFTHGYPWATFYTTIYNEQIIVMLSRSWINIVSMLIEPLTLIYLIGV